MFITSLFGRIVAMLDSGWFISIVMVAGDLFETFETTCMGSIFIQSFCKRLMEAKGQEDINRILTRVLRDTNEELETKVPATYKRAHYRLPVVINMLTKLLFLKPEQQGQL